MNCICNKEMHLVGSPPLPVTTPPIRKVLWDKPQYGIHDIRSIPVYNYICSCGMHHYRSNYTPPTWFTKEQWEAWVESYQK